MAALLVIIMLMIFFFLLAGIRDLCKWIFQKNETKSVDRWTKFREIGEENRK